MRYIVAAESGKFERTFSNCVTAEIYANLIGLRLLLTMFRTGKVERVITLRFSK